MKRKGPRNIPDFSPKAKPGAGTPPNAKAAPAPVRQPQPKPQATSSKSGRRGQ